MTEQNKEVLLSIQDLHVWFELRRFGFGHAGYVKAVDGVSFDLAEGETVAVVGESGCGKSSLMKTILALLKARPSSTHANCCGNDKKSATAGGVNTACSMSTPCR